MTARHGRSVSFAARLVVALCAVAALAAACGGSGPSTQQTPLISEGAAFPAPEFPSGHTWFNVSRPLTISELKGKVVVLDFWTLGCINCQQIVPDLNHLEDQFGDAVAIIGVQSGKYDREHADDSVREAVLRLRLRHPVVNDPDFAIWSAYGANAWPTIVVIDPTGNVVGAHEGEGVYDAVEPRIAELVAKFDQAHQTSRTPLPIDLAAAPIASGFLRFPGAILADEAGGRLFIADSGNNRVLVSGLDGKLREAIGSGAEGFKDGPLNQAQFDQPQGIALSTDGNTLFVADTRNHAVRAVDLVAGEVRTIAGDGRRLTAYPSTPAPAISTSLASPWGLLVSGNTLYVAMAGSHQLWTIDLAAQTTAIFAGSGAEGIGDGPRLSATLAQPNGLTTDGTSLFWVDPESSSVRSVALSGEGDVRTIVGTGVADFGDADGPASTAKLQHAQGVAYVNGLLYLADTYNHKIRTVNPATGQVNTVAGTGNAGDSDGSTAAAFNEPGGVSGGNGVLYIADTNNNAVRVLDLKTGGVSTLKLSNLSVASASLLGRTLKTSLSPEVISPSAGTLRLHLIAPEGYQLNELAPSQLTLATSNPDAFSPGKSEISFATAETSVEVTVPADVKNGQAILSVTGDIYYCREGEEAVCLIDRLDIALPVTVAAAGASSEALMEYQLPPVAGQ